MTYFTKKLVGVVYPRVHKIQGGTMNGKATKDISDHIFSKLALNILILLASGLGLFGLLFKASVAIIIGVCLVTFGILGHLARIDLRDNIF